MLTVKEQNIEKIRNFAHENYGGSNYLDKELTMIFQQECLVAPGLKTLVLNSL